MDRLTGVANRQALLGELFAEVERAGRYERPLSVAFVDIDHFKAVNDSYGHAAGDVVLRGVAQTISENLRASDRIGRYGGEEFMLILTETDVDEGAVLTEKLRTLVQRQRFVVDGNAGLSVTISIGIAGGTGPGLRMDSLVRDADAAMYSAKSLGRNQTYVFAEPDDDARVPRAPISAAGRAHAVAIGKQAREAATLALTSVLNPLPHYRGQPSALIASIVVALAATTRAAGCRGRPDPDRCAAPRRRQDRRPRGHPREAGGADVGRVANRRPAPADRPGDPGTGRLAQGGRADHPPPPRALRRPRLPVWPARERDPARRADRRDRRRLRRDDPRPAVQARDVARERRSRNCAATPAPSSTRSW